VIWAGLETFLNSEVVGYIGGGKMLGIVRKKDLEYGEMYCSLCGENVDREEFVLANLNLVPSRFLCRRCAERVAEFAREFRDYEDEEEWE